MTECIYCLKIGRVCTFGLGGVASIPRLNKICSKCYVIDFKAKNIENVLVIYTKEIISDIQK
jgi:hypothetical protein